MKILYAADTHASVQHLERLIHLAAQHATDAIVIGGDIVPHHLPDSNGHRLVAAQKRYLRQELIPRLQRFRDLHPAAIFLDLGNDDFWSNRHLLEEQNGHLLHLLHMRRHVLSQGLDIIGYMNVPPTPYYRKDAEKPDTPGQPIAPGNQVMLSGWRSSGCDLLPADLDLASPDTIEKDMRQLDKLVRGPFVFVSHSPPYDCPLDVIHSGRHVGSLAIRDFILRWGRRGMLRLSLHGHIHEAPQRCGTYHTRIGSVLSINPGQLEGLDASLQCVWLDVDPQSPDIRHVLCSAIHC